MSRSKKRQKWTLGRLLYRAVYRSSRMDRREQAEYDIYYLWPEYEAAWESAVNRQRVVFGWTNHDLMRKWINLHWKKYRRVVFTS